LLDENAVSFAQAEKLYYETSLISVESELQSTQNEPGIIYIVLYMISYYFINAPRWSSLQLQTAEI